MSGPPRAGHIWTDPGAWFFHLQFYKKYVIIFKKGKISHENFFAWAFYQERAIHNNRMEIRLTFEILFWQRQAKFFENCGQKFFWKLQAKLASKILYIVKYGYFIMRGVLITRERKWDLLSKDFFENAAGFFWEAKLASKILDFFRNDYFIERGLFITRERKLDLFLRYFFKAAGKKFFLYFLSR